MRSCPTVSPEGEGWGAGGEGEGVAEGDWQLPGEDASAKGITPISLVNRPAVISPRQGIRSPTKKGKSLSPQLQLVIMVVTKWSVYKQ